MVQDILVSDLVVGDIIVLEQGDRVPADCLLVQEIDMFVDQSYYTGGVDEEQRNVEKQCSYGNVQEDQELNPDPILLQDSIIMSGSGKAIVLATGKRTLREKHIKKKIDAGEHALEIGKKVTPFQTKLNLLFVAVTNASRVLLWGVLTLFVVVWLIMMLVGEFEMFSAQSFQRFMAMIETAVALIIVIIPTGLPMVVSMCMAFSIDKLED